MSVELNGTTQTLSASTDLGINGFPFTIACWMKIGSTGNTAYTFSYTPAASNYAGAYVNASEQLNSTLVMDSGATATITTDTADTSTWVPMICVYQDDPDQTVIHAFDGDTDTTAAAGAIIYPTESSPTFVVGDRAASFYFDGLINHIVVWSGVLSAANITAFLAGNDPADIDSGNQLAYWDFTDNIVGALTDEVSSIVLTNNNTATYSSDNPSVPQITSVSSDDTIDATENPWNITGTGFGSA